MKRRSFLRTLLAAAAAPMVLPAAVTYLRQWQWRRPQPVGFRMGIDWDVAIRNADALSAEWANDTCLGFKTVPDPVTGLSLALSQWQSPRGEIRHSVMFIGA